MAEVVVMSGPTSRVKAGVARNQAVRPELFPERAISVTRSFRETEGEPLVIRRAKMLVRILEEHPVIVQEGEVIIGMKTRKPRGSPVFPEISAQWVERDLDKLATRKDTPFFVSDETKALLAEEVFPYWRGRQVYNRILEAVPGELWRPDDRGVVYHYFRSRTIGHINAGYAKVLSNGVNGIKDELARSLDRLDREDPAYYRRRQFLESVSMVSDAVIKFARRHSGEARRLASLEEDPERRAELLKIAAVCERVPAEPARTFQEALQSFWFVHLVLNLETDGHAFGPGRFDQYLYSYYRHSLDGDEISRDQAQ